MLCKVMSKGLGVNEGWSGVDILALIAVSALRHGPARNQLRPTKVIEREHFPDDLGQNH